MSKNKIISLVRNVNVEGVPNIFTVGEAAGGEGPVVEKIGYQKHEDPTRAFYKEHCYIIYFADSNIRRVIPANKIEDIAYENTKDDGKGDLVPELPTD